MLMLLMPTSGGTPWCTLQTSWDRPTGSCMSSQIQQGLLTMARLHALPIHTTRNDARGCTVTWRRGERESQLDHVLSNYPEVRAVHGAFQDPAVLISDHALIVASVSRLALCCFHHRPRVRRRGCNAVCVTLCALPSTTAYNTYTVALVGRDVGKRDACGIYCCLRRP